MTIFRCKNSILHAEDMRSDVIVALCRAGFKTFDELFDDFDGAYRATSDALPLIMASLHREDTHKKSISFCGKASRIFYEESYEFSDAHKLGFSSIVEICTKEYEEMYEIFGLSTTKLDRICYALGAIKLELRPSSLINSKRLLLVLDHLDAKIPAKDTVNALNISLTKLYELRKIAKSLRFRIKGYEWRFANWLKAMERFNEARPS